MDQAQIIEKNQKECFTQFLECCCDGNIEEIEKWLETDISIDHTHVNTCWCGCNEQVSFIRKMGDFPVDTLQYLIDKGVIQPYMSEVPESDASHVYSDGKIHGSGVLWALHSTIRETFYYHRYHDPEYCNEFCPEVQYNNDDIKEHDLRLQKLESVLFLIEYLGKFAPELLKGLYGQKYEDYDDRMCLVRNATTISVCDNETNWRIYSALVENGVDPFAFRPPQFILGHCITSGQTEIIKDMFSRLDELEAHKILNNEDEVDDDCDDTLSNAGKGGYLLKQLRYIIDNIYSHLDKPDEWAQFRINRDLKNCLTMVELGIELDKTDKNGFNVGDYILLIKYLWPVDFELNFDETPFCKAVDVVALHDIDTIKAEFEFSIDKLKEAYFSKNYAQLNRMLSRGFDVYETDEDDKTILDYLFDERGIQNSDEILDKLNYDETVCTMLNNIIMRIASTEIFYHYPEDDVFYDWAIAGGNEDDEPDMSVYVIGHEAYYQGTMPIYKYKRVYKLMIDIIGRLCEANPETYGKNSVSRVQLIEALKSNHHIDATTISKLQSY